MAVSSDASPLHERARGRWKIILPALGIDQRFLTGKNGPCPLCPDGGRDRWRFDNKRGDGTWICSHCGAGVGVGLALRYTRQSFRDVALCIERILGETPQTEPEQPLQSDASKRDALNRLWRSSKPVASGDPVDLWMTARGIRQAAYSKALRFAQNVRYSGPPASWHPTMLAMVTSPVGAPGTIHKTYLNATGAKAPVDKVRMFCAGTVPPGGAVRLAEFGDVLGIAEGIETAFAAERMFGIPTWAALNAGGLEKFEPPQEVRRLVIFGDNDVNGVGQRAAYALAARMSGRLTVEPRIPEQAGADWNDVLRG